MSDALVPITQHAEQGLVSLPDWCWGKPRLGAWLVSYLRTHQGLEDLIWEVIEAREIETANISRLQVIGKLLGQARHGFAPELFRSLLKARAVANRSDGSGPFIGRTLFELLGEGNFRFYFVGPATMLVQVLFETDAENVRAAAAVLPFARGTGVRLSVLFSPDSSTESYDYAEAGLIFSDAADPVTTPGSPWYDVRIA